MLWNFPGDDSSLWRALDFYKLTRFRNTIWTSTKPFVFRVRTKTYFMDDFIVAFLIENTSLVLI